MSRIVKLCIALMSIVAVIVGVTPSAATGSTPRKAPACTARFEKPLGFFVVGACEDEPGSKVQLVVRCLWEPTYHGPVTYVRGTVTFEEYSCLNGAVDAWVAYL